MASSGSSDPHRSQQLGVTEPISLIGPSHNDLIKTHQLEKYLKDAGCYESEEKAISVEVALGKLEQIVNTWVKAITRAKGLNELLVQEATAKIYTFGSYRIGVNVDDADIGVLCVGPKNATREEDFFGELYHMLSEMAEITKLDRPLPDVDVPMLKFELDGVSINLLYAKLSLWVIPDDLDISSDTILQNTDEQTVRSMNRCRNTDEILRLVPDTQNFQTTLRGIILWAKLRGIYSNVVGFLGCISWALLVARVCQLYPNASPNMLVSRFFRLYNSWRWPNPVLISHIREGSLGLEYWNPKVNLEDRSHLMPIITPAYPCINSSYNVSSTTLRIILDEFRRGYEICEAMETNRADWDALFKPRRFFEAYKNYLQIDISAENSNDLRQWKAWVESCLPKLTQNILRDTYNMLQCHPHPDGFADESKPCHYYYFTGLLRNRQARSEASGPFDIRSTVEEFKSCVSMYIMWKPGMEIYVSHVKRKNVPAFVFPGGVRSPGPSKEDGVDRKES